MLRVVYGIPVCIVVGLIAFIYNAYVIEYNGAKLHSADGATVRWGIFQLLVFHVWVIPLVASYANCVRTGRVPLKFGTRSLKNCLLW